MKRFISILSALLKLTIILCVTWGVTLSALDPMAYMPEKTIWMYFTVQSNLGIGLMALAGLLVMVGRIRPGRWFAVLELITTVAITLTGMIYCFLLAPVKGECAFSICSVLTHIVVPLAAILDFFVCSYKYELQLWDSFYALIPPVLYFVFATVAYSLDWTFANGMNYPYFFLNYGSKAGILGFSSQLPYMGVMYYAIGILIVVYIVTCFYIAMAQSLRRLW